MKEVKKRIDAELSSRRLHRDQEGRVIINMKVKDDSNFLSVFSENDTPVISSEVADFIETRTGCVPPREPLTLRIHSNCIDGQEQVQYREAIREYYAEQYVANKRELHRNKVIAVILLLLGIAVLAFSIFKSDSAVVSEVIDIVAWVLIWESVDISFFGNRNLRWRQNRCLACISMKIEYISE